MYSIIKSGMASAMHELSVISNNVSNANSNGFKKSLVSFADFAGGLFPASVQSSANGLGSRVEETRVSDAQGAILSTENKTDMALIGNGYFALQNLNDNTVSFTRNGAFGLDEQGFLTTADNHRVLGTPIFENDFGQTPDNIEALQPIQIPSIRDDLVMSELEIAEDGRISARYGEQDPVPISSLTIGIFSNPIGLKELGNARFSATERSGLLTLGAPMDSGFADLQVGGLEISNVNITDELTAMIKAQQQFNGSARLMQANSDMVEKLTR
ncbi:MAG: flagellar basal body rod protein FlgG [Rhodobacterales bacterium]|nr:MAG: flagellar basal body rod protein FlgG [Rhodobacterales bacterium]|tara:strand:- start:2580 stop:3392 length:813 start_codon:yes stop_codon:yes gene_type:complete